HRVTVLERDAAAGGQLRLVAALPLQAPFAELVRWRLAELGRLGVEVRYGVGASAEAVLALRPDAVVVATGSRPGPVDGCEPAAHVVRSLVDRRGTAAVVRAAGDAPPGAAGGGPGTVVLVDTEGHRKGVGTAELLAAAGWRVTLVAVGGPAAGLLENSKSGPLALRRLRDLGVRLVEGHRVVGLSAGVVRLARRYDDEPLDLVADRVVLAVPHEPVDGLVAPLRRAGVDVRAVGDARAPRLVEDAVHDGYRVGAQL
ncbi:MAG: hypothetical protein ACKVZ6_20315, partial [Kineosporiaceae bacterium]